MEIQHNILFVFLCLQAIVHLPKIETIAFYKLQNLPLRGWVIQGPTKYSWLTWLHNHLAMSREIK